MLQIKTLITSMLLVFFLFSQPVTAAPQEKSVLYGFDGSPQTLANYAGKDKWLVVMFWASDCHICGAKAPDYVKFDAKHQDDNMRIIGVSVDGLENKTAAQGFIDEHQIKFPNLIGNLEDIAGMYYDMTGDHWLGTPTFFIYEPSGELRIVQAGITPTELIEEFINNNSVASAE